MTLWTMKSTQNNVDNIYDYGLAVLEILTGKIALNPKNRSEV